MKKGKVYTVKVVLQSNGDIAKAVCGCPAGVDGRCNQLAATMFAIEDQWNIKARCATSNGRTETPANVPCTSQPRTWNVPRKRKLNAEPIQCLKFQKHTWGKRRLNIHPEIRMMSELLTRGPFLMGTLSNFMTK